jgi:hypothetical protein
MTKLVSLRITVAADDAVKIEDLKARLFTVVSDVGTEQVGEARVHWGTAEVLQGPERVNARRGGRKIAAVVGQGQLA